jgi:hypothetical protein
LEIDDANDSDYEIDNDPAQETAAVVANWDEDENIKESSVEGAEAESEEEEGEPEIAESESESEDSLEDASEIITRRKTRDVRQDAAKKAKKSQRAA